MVVLEGNVYGQNGMVALKTMSWIRKQHHAEIVAIMLAF
jgi:hypothetical protein